MQLPGTRLLACARLLVDPAAVASVLEPLVADWQREWLVAATARRRTLVRVRGLIAFLASSAYCVATMPVPRDMRRTTCTMLLSFGALGVLILLVPPSTQSVPWRLLPLWLPSSAVLAAPFAVLPLAMKLSATGQSQSLAARHLVRIVLLVVALVFISHNWVTPYANRTFRNAMFAESGFVFHGGMPRLGPRELTLQELMTIQAGMPGIGASSRQLHEERHNRASIPLIPIALAVLGWSLGRVARPSGLTRLVFWWAFAALTFGLARSLGMTFERAWDLPRELAVWLPLALWCTAIAALAIAGGAKAPPLPMDDMTDAARSER